MEIIKHSRMSAMITEFCGSFLWMNFCSLLLSRKSEIELILSAFFQKKGMKVMNANEMNCYFVAAVCLF